MLDRVSPYKEGGDWVRIDLKPGKQHLDADQAFAYVRARTQSSDYSRIARQRCVIASLAAKATPAKVLGSFRDLASTFKENVRTDIPAKNLPLVAELAAGVHLDRVTSIGFVPPQFERARDPAGYSIPDVVKIRAAVAERDRRQRRPRPARRPRGVRLGLRLSHGSSRRPAASRRRRWSIVRATPSASGVAGSGAPTTPVVRRCVEARRERQLGAVDRDLRARATTAVIASTISVTLGHGPGQVQRGGAVGSRRGWRR